MTSAPRLRVEAACQHLGRDEFIRRCVAVLNGDEADPEFLTAIGGGPALELLSKGMLADQTYWSRVWAARGLLWAGPPPDSLPIRVGLEDESWRVREMTCKVIARHRLDELLDELIPLKVDPVARVQAAAARATRRIVEEP